MVPSFLKVVKGVARAVGDVASVVSTLAGDVVNSTSGDGGPGAAAGFPIGASVAIAIGLLSLAVMFLICCCCLCQQLTENRLYR